MCFSLMDWSPHNVKFPKCSKFPNLKAVTTSDCSFTSKFSGQSLQTVPHYFIIRRNRSCNATDCASSYTFLCCVVCLSVSHIRVSCLNCSTDLDATSHVHLRGPATHCVRWGPEEEIWGQTPSQNMQLKTAAKPSVLCCHLANTNEDLGWLAIAIPPFANTSVLVKFMPDSGTGRT